MNGFIQRGFLFLGGGLILPLIIGAAGGVGLNRAADGNETYPFAESYYQTVIPKMPDYTTTRDRYTKTGYNPYGLKVSDGTICRAQDWIFPPNSNNDQVLLDNASLIHSALAYQRSLVLAQKFEDPAIMSLENLTSPVVGALNGCQYTILGPLCDYAGALIINDSYKKNRQLLETTRREWLSIHESGSCFVKNKIISGG